MNEVNVCFLNSHWLFLSPSKEMATTGAAQMKQLLTEYHLKGYDLAELADNELSNIVAFTLQAIGAVMAPDKLKSLEPTEIVERYGESTLKPTSPLVFRWRWKGDKHSLLGAWRYISPEHSGDFRGTEKLINDPNVEYQWLGDSAALREAQQAAFYNGLQLHEALTDIAELESSRGAVDIINERKRQITKEGRTAENDDAYTNGQLADAAATYAAWAKSQGEAVPENFWPWGADVWKQAGERRDLVKAGALIVAEIDRIDRAAEKGAKEIDAYSENIKAAGGTVKDGE